MWALKNNFGWATQGALLGVTFAAEGLTGNHRILEGETGFWSMAGSDQVDRSAFTAGLGSHYSLLDTSFKPYPCCRFTHTALDGLGQLVRSARRPAGQVREVRIRSSSKIRAFADYRPRSLFDAQFSLPYLAAMVLLQVPPGYGWLEAERWQDAAVLALADRVVLEVDPDWESNLAQGGMASTVCVEFEGGQTEQVEVLHARGDPRHPLSPDELREKFLGLAGPVIGPARARQLDEALDHLEDVERITEVTEYLAGNQISGVERTRSG